MKKTYWLAVSLFFIILAGLAFSLMYREKNSPQVISNNSILSSSSDKSLKERLAECIPKSDMESKNKCDQILKEINSFEGCVEAGFPIMKSLPEKCQTPDGRTFTATRPKKDLTGTFACLPVRDPSVPHNDICRFSIKTEDGNYAIDSNLIGNLEIKTGERIKISGYFTPIEFISSNIWQEYDLKGFISVTEIKKSAD